MRWAEILFAGWGLLGSPATNGDLTDAPQTLGAIDTISANGALANVATGATGLPSLKYPLC